MAKVYPNIEPNVENWPIYQQSKNRSQFISELNDFTFEKITSEHSDLERVLTLTIYFENQRVKNNPWKVDPADDKKYWRNASSDLKKALLSDNPQERMQILLKKIIHRYNEEIVGGFQLKTYHFATRNLIRFYRRIYNKFSDKGFLRPWGDAELLYSRMHLHGPVEQIRELAKKGTVLVLPTHNSNLDSVMVGFYTSMFLGLPPFAFGAGLNLLDYEIVAYFINRLGAYRVDRRKKSPVYLECLKAMNCLSIYKGVNNIFFPGGTRIRSGEIENKVKLGLLGSVIQAQRMKLQDKEGQKIFIVPAVFSYSFVLEANSLVEQHLAIRGRERYLKSKRKISSFKKNWKFIRTLFSKKSEITLSFGPPLDVLGNKVDAQGDSLDERGRQIDIKKYFISPETGGIERNDQREKIYTRKLGEKVTESFYQNHVVLLENFVCFVIFEVLLRKFKASDFYSFIVSPPQDVYLKIEELIPNLESCRQVLLKYEQDKKLILTEKFSWDIRDIIDHAVKNVGIYHVQRVIYIERDYIRTDNLKLLYYYHNKLRNYGMESEIDWQITKQLIGEPIS